MGDKLSPFRVEIVGPDSRRSEPAAPAGRARQIVRALQVRLRFILVLAAAFLVVGLWGNLRNVWDTWQHRLVGSQALQHSVSVDTEYFCPMCPGVISDWPAICPVCSMDLVRRKKGDAVLLPEGVVARMQLSPYRIQLAGIATTVIERRPLAREITVAGRVIELPSEPPADDSPERSAKVSGTASRFVLECPVATSELSLFTAGRAASVTLDGAGAAAPLSGQIEKTESAAGARPAPVRHTGTIHIRLAESAGWVRAGMYGTARIGVPVSEFEPFASWPGQKPGNSASELIAVPESAVVDTGSRRVVFVETMPGMFDGLEVALGPLCGDYYPVIKGLEAGQKVASVGAFLIDAEARLSPDMAAAYFGAARTSAPSAASGAPARPSASKRSKKSAVSKLSAADLKLVQQQKICPVTEADLDSMGGPIPVEVAGQRVFICCQGCEKALKADPQKYLAKLKK